MFTGPPLRSSDTTVAHGNKESFITLQHDSEPWGFVITFADEWVAADHGPRHESRKGL